MAEDGADVSRGAERVLIAGVAFAAGVAYIPVLRRLFDRADWF